MKIIKSNVKEVIFHVPEGYRSIEEFLERVARTCYQSEGKIKPGSANKLLNKLMDLGHHAMFDHIFITARIEADRGFTHELVRHRLAAYAQESTRYCNYVEGKFSGQITVIEQPELNSPQREIWRIAMQSAEHSYMDLIGNGVSPQIARSILPIGLKSEIVITANLREWWHIFKLRCSEKVHPIMRKVMDEIRNIFIKKHPILMRMSALTPKEELNEKT